MGNKSKVKSSTFAKAPADKQKSKVKEIIIEQVQKIVTDMGAEDVQSSLERPADESHGDYSSNVSFSLAKQLKKSPMEVAEEIAEKLNVSFRDEVEESQKPESVVRDPSTTVGMTKILDKVEAVKPGFLNFWLSKDFLSSHLKGMIDDPEKVGTTTKMENKKVMTEFTDPNPFKEFHIGHLYSNIVGESLSRLLESQGAEVRRVTYQGDVGLHVAKSLWGMRQLASDMPQESAKPNEKAAYLGKCYALGASKYEEDEAAKQEIIAINKKVYSKEDAEINALYDMGKKWSLDYFQQIYDRLDSNFTRNYFESEAGPKGVAMVKEHMHDGIFEEHDGAVVFRGEPYGLHTRVFINSLGLPTYEAKELGLAPTKYSEYQYDESIIITGNEIKEYFKVLLKVLSLINPELASKTTHITHGMVRLPGGKMSSRTGNVITGEWLLNEAMKKAEEMARPGFDPESSTGSQEMLNQVTGSSEHQHDVDSSPEQVGVGAVKYAFLKSSIGKDIEFDFETSLSLNGNSGPYLQYSYVRTQSVLEKAKIASSQAPRNDEGSSSLDYPSNYTPNEDEISLLRLLTRFTETVEDAAEHLSPSSICTYLYDLAKMYNLFYQKVRILNADTQEEKEFRLALTKGVGIVLKKGLYLLGIQAPQRM